MPDAIGLKCLISLEEQDRLHQPVRGRVAFIDGQQVVACRRRKLGRAPEGIVRDLAQEAAVNPNTMQKALSELERSGLIYSQRTSGRFITEDKELIHQMKKELAAAEVSAFVAHMKQLGITPEEIRQLLAETIEEEENHE